MNLKMKINNYKILIKIGFQKNKTFIVKRLVILDDIATLLKNSKYKDTL